MAPHDVRRPFKRALISDQQKRRDLALLRQNQNRRDSQLQARSLASSLLSLHNQDLNENQPTTTQPQQLNQAEAQAQEQEEEEEAPLDICRASKLKGAEARQWFSRQLMLPEWMVDIPSRLSTDWYVFARPSGKRCFVVSSDGTTVSRLRNGSVLHHFPSALPNGARTKNNSGSAHSFCLLDCIFHEADQTYYVIDMVCWRGYSLYDCSAEFRFFWLNSKLAETGACEPPSPYHRYRFTGVPIYNCDYTGLQAAYVGDVPYAKDGLLFYNKYAHYQTGNTPLALVWKDESCSEYVLDTDNMGQVPAQQQVVLELQGDGKLTTSDDPPIVFSCLDQEFIQKFDLRSGSLLRFAVSDGGMRFLDGKLESADLHYIGKSNRARAFADTYSKGEALAINILVRKGFLLCQQEFLCESISEAVQHLFSTAPLLWRCGPGWYRVMSFNANVCSVKSLMNQWEAHHVQKEMGVGRLPVWSYGKSETLGYFRKHHAVLQV